MSVDTFPKLNIELSSIQKMGENDIFNFLSDLKDFECWNKYVEVINYLSKHKRISKRILSVTIYCYAIYLEDTNSITKIAKSYVSHSGIKYKEFYKEVLEPLTNKIGYGLISEILESSVSAFKDKESKIQSIEQLCLIYEKKRFDEISLNKSYSKLIDIDPYNIRALKYFKVLYSENNQWDLVAQILNKLYKSSKHPTDKYKFALELASTLLYQLDSPKEAVEVIESKCVGSPINSLTVHYDAYYSLKDWNGCLRVLNDSLIHGDRALNKSVIYYKMGELQDILGQIDKAEESFLKSAELDPDFLEPVEGLIEMSVTDKEWTKLLKYLDLLKSRLKSERDRIRVGEAYSRLESCL